MSRIETISMGCRLNIAESDAIKAALDREQTADDPPLVIVNSCAVTNEAVRQTRQAIRRAKRANEDARIIVTGCAAQTDPQMFAEMPEVAGVVGNGEKASAANFLGFDDSARKVRVADIMEVQQTNPHLSASFSDRARAFVEVQNGCDHRCTFCIIPYGRGPSRSVPAGALVDKVKALVDEGFGEVVLTGVDVTSYGHDLPGKPNLGLLIERLLRAVPALSRLRLSSLDGVEIDERLFDLLSGEARVMPHIHLSLQSGDDMILKRMKRRHTRAQAIDLVARLKDKRPDISVGADIIAGFPTETDTMFENSIDIVRQCDVVHGHIFPYSERDRTPAARMPQVDHGVRKDRARLLREAVADARHRWLSSLIGTRQSVLVERGGEAGHAENFAPVRLDRTCAEGMIADVTITGVANGRLSGELADGL